MKYQITPLNIVLAAIAVWGILWPKAELKAVSIGWLALLMGLLFVVDLIFRFVFKNLKKIWLIESLFILIVAILIALLKK